jgi:hypothetical protein
MLKHFFFNFHIPLHQSKNLTKKLSRDRLRPSLCRQNLLNLLINLFCVDVEVVSENDADEIRIITLLLGLNIRGAVVIQTAFVALLVVEDFYHGFLWVTVQRDLLQATCVHQHRLARHHMHNFRR